MGNSTSSLAAEGTPGVLADDIPGQARPHEETNGWGAAFHFLGNAIFGPPQTRAPHDGCVDEEGVEGRDEWDPHTYGRESPTARRATVLAHLSI